MFDLKEVHNTLGTDNEFGLYLRKLRGAKSLRKASKEIGISHTYLDSLEKGLDPRSEKERMPSIETMRKISKVYNIDLIELLIEADYLSTKDVKQYITNNI